jgi:hypothetical protein
VSGRFPGERVLPRRTPAEAGEPSVRAPPAAAVELCPYRKGEAS